MASEKKGKVRRVISGELGDQHCIKRMGLEKKGRLKKTVEESSTTEEKAR